MGNGGPIGWGEPIGWGDPMGCGGTMYGLRRLNPAEKRPDRCICSAGVRELERRAAQVSHEIAYGIADDTAAAHRIAVVCGIAADTGLAATHAVAAAYALAAAHLIVGSSAE